MESQLFNPYLSVDEYVPDGEPYVFEDRLYVFGSHELAGGNTFCPLDYVLWSTPVDDLSKWKSHGVIYSKKQDPENREGELNLFAPDMVQGEDGRFYLFYGLGLRPQISVAVCNTIDGQYHYLGKVKNKDQTVLEENVPFDPAVINDDGRIYLYYGFAPPFSIHGKNMTDCPGCSVVELERDMMTVKGNPTVVIPSMKRLEQSDYAGIAYFEAPSIRKIGNKYYLVYASSNNHELCYAVSNYPDKGFEYGGVIISNGDVGIDNRCEADGLWSTGNNHGGMVEVHGQWYIFYHRHTHGTMFSRQGCAEPIVIKTDGHIAQVEMTSAGLLNRSLKAVGDYPASIACNLVGKSGTKSPIYGKVLDDVPVVSSIDGKSAIVQIEDGTIIGYKYFEFREGIRLGMTYCGSGEGTFEIMSGFKGEEFSAVKVSSTTDTEWCTAWVDVKMIGCKALYLKYRGTGSMNLLKLSFE